MKLCVIAELNILQVGSVPTEVSDPSSTRQITPSTSSQSFILSTLDDHACSLEAVILESISDEVNPTNEDQHSTGVEEFDVDNTSTRPSIGNEELDVDSTSTRPSIGDEELMDNVDLAHLVRMKCICIPMTSQLHVPTCC